VKSFSITFTAVIIPYQGISIGMYNRGMIGIQKCTNREQWDDYVLETGGHPLQLWGWGQAKAGHGWTADRFFLIDDEAPEIILSAAQVLTRHLPFPLRAFSYIPRGPIGERDEELLGFIAENVKREYKSLALSVEPETTEFIPPVGWQKGSNAVLPAATIALDLKKSESDLLTDMAKKTRQYIRKSAAEAVEIRQVRTKAELESVLKIYHDTAKRAKFNLHSDQYYLDVFTAMADNCLVYATYEGETPIAFLWLALSAATAFELYGGVNERGQELRVNYALKWYAIRKAKEWGLTTYDFGGLISGGVSVFKQGWASEETHLAGTFDRPLSIFYGLWAKGLPAAKAVVHKLRR
jgi:peptidoglycan pentaglycine glycine transferase (the first glycine)